TAEMFLKKEAVLEILPLASAVIGSDAAKHMKHYMDNTGNDLTIDLVGMVNDVPSAKFNYEEELKEAARFVETLPAGVQRITSTSINRKRKLHMYNQKSESWNWFFAIGGYSAWGKGRAEVIVAGGARSYKLDFEYKFFDRYNWDAGKSVTIFGITVTDNTMGE